MPQAAVPIIGAVAGSLVSGAMNKKNSGGTQSVDKSPWEPVQPFLKDLIGDGQSLYSNYKQNPFSDAQKTAYQNQFTMNDAYNNQIMPGLLKGFQGLLGSGFGDISSGLLGGLAGANQRLMPTQSQSLTPEQQSVVGNFIRDNVDNQALVRSEQQRLGLSNADVLGAARTVDPNIQMSSVNSYLGRQDPQYARPSFGLLDFSQYSPWTNGSMATAANAQAQAYANMTPEERQRAEYEEYLRNSGMYYQGAGAAGTGAGGGGAPSGAPGTGGSPGDSSGW